MKRSWKSWLAVAVSFAAASPAMAQQGRATTDSYQQILSNAGYASSESSQPILGPPRQDVEPSPATAPATVMDPAVAGTPQFHESVETYGGGYADSSCDTGTGHGWFGGWGQNWWGGGQDSNAVVGIFGLYFDRDYEDDLPLASGAGANLFSTSADNDGIGGLGVDLTRRNCQGRGHQFRYWGLYSEISRATLGPGPFATSLPGLADVTLSGNSVDQIYNLAGSQTVARETEIHNFEFNLLRNGGTYTSFGGRAASFERFAGFRWFQFNEDFRYAATADVSGGAPAGVPINTFFDSEIENTMLGLHLGGRSEICLTERIRANCTLRLGLFNNHVESNQRINAENGPFATINGVGTAYNFNSDKDDIAFLSEIDAALSYQFTEQARFTAGYRLLGIAGVGLAADQIPTNFANELEIQRIKTNGDLMLQGGYFGLEWAY